MGMVAADRVFKIIATESKIDDNGNVQLNELEGKSTLRIFDFLIYLEKKF